MASFLSTHNNLKKKWTPTSLIVLANAAGLLDVLLSDSTREELDGWAVTLGLDPSDYKDKTTLKRAMYAANSTQRVAGPCSCMRHVPCTGTFRGTCVLVFCYA